MFGDKLGRRKMMFTGATVLTLGVVIQVTCFGGSWAGVFFSLHSNLLPLLIFLIPGGQFIIGRIVTGLGTGFLT